MSAKRAFTMVLGFTAFLTHPSIAQAQLHVDSSCDDGQITVQWTYDDDPSHGRPDWVGYDVLRRPVGTCAWERVHDESFPRIVGTHHGHTFVDGTAASGITYDYHVALVDADHDVLAPSSLCVHCPDRQWISCPPYAQPVTVGRVLNLGLGLYRVEPCPDGCYEVFYLRGDPALPALAASGETYAFYGDEQYRTIEGSQLTVVYYEAVGCGPTPARATSWGRVKVIYR